MNMDAWARKSPNIHRFICLTLLLALCLGFHPDDASAFDDVSAIGTSRKGPIARIDPLKDGVVVHYADGANIRFKDNINPNRGSPVNYRYVAFDAALQAYVMDVWVSASKRFWSAKAQALSLKSGGHGCPPPTNGIFSPPTAGKSAAITS